MMLRERVFADAAPGTIPRLEHRSEKSVWRVVPRGGVVRFEPPELIKPWHVGTVLRGKTSGNDTAALIVHCVLHDALNVVVEREARPSRIPLMSIPEMVAFTRGDRFDDVDDSDIALVTKALHFSLPRHRISSHDAAEQLARAGIVKKICDAAPSKVHSGRQNAPIRNALTVQIHGFAHYLRTAETSSFVSDDLASLYRQYLPWAVALDVTDEWSSKFASIPNIGSDVAYLSSKTHAIMDSPIGELGTELLVSAALNVVSGVLNGLSW